MARMALADPVSTTVILWWQCLNRFFLSRQPLGTHSKFRKVGLALRGSSVSYIRFASHCKQPIRTEQFPFAQGWANSPLLACGDVGTDTTDTGD